MGFFSQLKDKLAQGDNPEEEFKESSKQEYVELGTDEEIETRTKSVVRPFTLQDFEDIKHVIDALREGNVIALINIRPLRDSEITELKRAVAKLRKTCDALEGEIAGFTEDLIIATSSSARIHKSKSVEKLDE